MTQQTVTLWRVRYRTAADSGTQADGLTFQQADELARDLTWIETERGGEVAEYFLEPYLVPDRTTPAR